MKVVMSMVECYKNTVLGGIWDESEVGEYYDQARRCFKKAIAARMYLTLQRSVTNQPLSLPQIAWRPWIGKHIALAPAALAISRYLLLTIG